MKQQTSTNRPVPPVHSDRPAPRPRFKEIIDVMMLAWPSTLSILVFTSLGLLSIRVVRPLGTGAIAAVSTGQRTLFLMQVLIFAVSTGAMALVAQRWGAGAKREAARLTFVSTLISIGVGLFSATMMWAAAPFISEVFIRDNPLAVAQSIQYHYYFAPWILVLSINHNLSMCFRAAGDAIQPLVSAAIQGVVATFFLLTLVDGNLGFPSMGLPGAPIAAGIGLSIATLYLGVQWLFFNKLFPRIPWPPIFHRRTWDIIRIAFPAAGEQLAIQGGLSIFLILLGNYGLAPYVAYGIGVQVLSFSFLIGFGFSMASSTLVGQAIGARDYLLAKSHAWLTVKLSVVCMTILSVIIVLLARQIAQFFTDDVAVQDAVVVFIYCLGSMQPLMAIEFTLSGALKGAADTRTPLVVQICGMLIVRCGLALFVVSQNWGYEWIYACLIGDYIVKSGIYSLYVRSGRWLPRAGRVRHS